MSDQSKSGSQIRVGLLVTCLVDLAREGSNIEVRHVAEVLAGMTEAAPICAASPEK